MQWSMVTVLLCAAWSASARLAIVGSSSGQIFHGQVRLTTQQIVLVNADQNFWLHLAPTDLAWAVFEEPAAPPPKDSPDTAPDAWQDQDIGRVTVHGGLRRGAGSFTVQSSGLGVQGLADSIHFVYQPAQSNCEIMACVTMVHQTHPAAQAGVMMREDLGADSRCVLLAVTPGSGGLLRWRDQQTGQAQNLPQPDMAAPCWMKLKREGNDFTAYKSRNGRQWTLAGKATVPMRGNFFAGLATASAREFVVNWTTFDKVRTGPLLGNLEFPPRAELVSGSVVVGWPVSAADTLDFRWHVASVLVPTRLVARMIFQWATPEWLAEARQERAGVWLANGEFLEGDFRALTEGKLRVSSVLYGSKVFDANNEVVMMAMKRGSVPPARYDVKTVNGTVWRAQSLAFGDNEVILREPALGDVVVPINELASILPRY